MSVDVTRLRHPHVFKFGAIYTLLCIVLIGAMVTLYKGVSTQYRTVTKYKEIPANLSTTAALEAALGQPAQAGMDCAQINAQLQGAKCDVYQRKSDLIIVAHA